MKNFFYTIQKKDAKYGKNVTNKVYRIVKNKVQLVGEKHYNTGSYKGDIHEAASLLVDKKQIPASWLEHGYVNYDKLDVKFTLTELS